MEKCQTAMELKRRDSDPGYRLREGGKAQTEAKRMSRSD